MVIDTKRLRKSLADVKREQLATVDPSDAHNGQRALIRIAANNRRRHVRAVEAMAREFGLGH